MTSLLQLPNEMLEKILVYLDKGALLNLRFLHRKFADVIPAIVRAQGCRITVKPNTAKYAVESFFLGNPLGSTSPLISQLTHLHLKMSYMSLDLTLFDDVFSKSPLLTSLVLESAQRLTSIKLDLTLLPPNLTAVEFNADDARLSQVAWNPEALQLVDTLWFDFLSVENDWSFIENLPKLEKLAVITSNQTLQMDMLATFEHTLSKSWSMKLRTLILAISGIYIPDTADLCESIARHCDCLEDLRLSIDGMNDEAVEKLCRKYHPDEAEEKGEKTFRTSVTHITILCMANDITPNIIPAIKSLPNLQKLALADANFVFDDEFIEQCLLELPGRFEGRSEYVRDAFKQF